MEISSPEGMLFIEASKSQNGKNLLIISYENSGKTVFMRLNKLIIQILKFGICREYLNKVWRFSLFKYG